MARRVVAVLTLCLFMAVSNARYYTDLPVWVELTNAASIGSISLFVGGRINDTINCTSRVMAWDFANLEATPVMFNGASTTGSTALRQQKASCGLIVGPNNKVF